MILTICHEKMMWFYCMKLLIRQRKWPDSIIAEKLILDAISKKLNYWLYDHNQYSFDAYERDMNV